MTKKIVVLLLVFIPLAVLVYYFVPPVVGKSMLNKAAKTSGFEKKTIIVDGHAISYLESGQGEAIVLLHGFGARKEDWLAFGSGLRNDYRIIIPDLPGFGESAKKDGASYSVASQAKRLNDFIGALQIARAHFAGNSLGAAIVGKLAADNPDKVQTLTLLDAACVAGAQPSEMQLLMEQGKNVLSPKNREEMDALLDMVFNKKPVIPFVLMEYLVREAIAESSFREKVAHEIWKEEKYALENDSSKIKAKTLIIWGQNDRLTHISGAEILQRCIGNSRVVLIADCGHSPMLEKPAETLNAFLNFIKE
ncbi:MAG: alpha/beta hydrolase [Deltaproteobacteria bacterium]|nr:alpha/beta hydrolase [Deltaproteobacteria bacterium]